MIIEIYHHIKPTFLESVGDWSQYVKVATIRSRRRLIRLGLDDAFRLTNTLERYWGRNLGVKAEPGEHRSTSVGDLAVINNSFVFLCCNVGWQMEGKLTRERRASHEHAKNRVRA